MDHHLENKFLNKVGASKEALQEKDDEEGYEMISGESTEQVQFQVFESFVKEKYSLLGYVKAMVLYSARQNGIEEADIAKIYPPEMGIMAKEKDVKNS